jgi:ANTAR domain
VSSDSRRTKIRSVHDDGVLNRLDELAAASGAPERIFEPQDSKSAEEAEDRIRHLVVALERRTVIGQATGILMERFELSSEVAFGVLVRVSQEQNVKVYDLALELAATGRAPGIRAPRA